MMSHDRAFLGEALDVFGLFLHVTERDKEREISIPMTGRLEHRVERPLHVFPESVAPRLDDHAASDIARFRHVASADDLLIPLRKVLVAARGDRGFWLIGFSHNDARYLNSSAEVDQRFAEGATETAHLREQRDIGR